jgi:hypothetical protein
MKVIGSSLRKLDSAAVSAAVIPRKKAALLQSTGFKDE